MVTNTFGLGIDQPDVRVVIHVGSIYQMRSYGQESGRAGRDGQRSEAIILMPVGKQEALQKAHKPIQRRPVIFRILTTAKEKEKQRIEQQEVERFVSGAVCRRTYLDQEMDGRGDHVGCEYKEECCDVCRENDAMMKELESQRRIYIQTEQDKQDRHKRWIESGIDTTSNNTPFRMVISDEFHSMDGPMPSSPPKQSQSSVISFNAGFPRHQISADERVELQSQQSQRQQQRMQFQEQIQQAGQAVWDLENRLDEWTGKCRLCYVRKYLGSRVDFQHTLEMCIDPEQELVYIVVGKYRGQRCNKG